jgi:hypothetical protein
MIGKLLPVCINQLTTVAWYVAAFQHLALGGEFLPELGPEALIGCAAVLSHELNFR